MGFSPLEGVPMATRSGSIDPGALLFVQRAHGLSVDEVDRALNEESGLEGLSGGRGLRALEAAAPDDESAQLALGVYTYRIAGAVAAMTAALGGLDALVFTAGVGEHSARVRVGRMRASRVSRRRARSRAERALDPGRGRGDVETRRLGSS